MKNLFACNSGANCANERDKGWAWVIAGRWYLVHGSWVIAGIPYLFDTVSWNYKSFAVIEPTNEQQDCK